MFVRQFFEWQSAERQSADSFNLKTGWIQLKSFQICLNLILRAVQITPDTFLRILDPSLPRVTLSDTDAESVKHKEILVDGFK